jgi:hypothetical protein
MRDGRLRRIAVLEATIAQQRPRTIAPVAEGQPHPADADFVTVRCGVRPASPRAEHIEEPAAPPRAHATSCR